MNSLMALKHQFNKRVVSIKLVLYLFLNIFFLIIVLKRENGKICNM